MRLEIGEQAVGRTSIFDQLTVDHNRQRHLLRCILDTSEDDEERLRLFEELSEELRAHAAAEEQTFYAELLALSHDEIQESVAANDEMAELIQQLYDLDAASPEWWATFKTLKEKVERHLDLEESLLCPRARKLINRNRAKWLAERFEQAKEQELAQGGGRPLDRSGLDLRHPAAAEPQEWPAMPRAATSVKG